MLHQNSVFHAVLQGVPWDVLDRLSEARGSDRGVRTLTTKSQLAALLYGQLAGASSLREIVAGLESHQSRLYHLGVRAARRSTLADANALRPAAVFGALFAEMAARAHRPLRKSLAGTTYLIDSTGLRWMRAASIGRASRPGCAGSSCISSRRRCRSADRSLSSGRPSAGPVGRDHPGADQ